MIFSTPSRFVVIMMGMFLTVTAGSVCHAEDEEDEQIHFLDIMSSYLDVSERIVSLASTKEAAVYFAVEGIVEIYEDRGELASAIPHLNNILDTYPNDRAVRNIVRFKLRDVYKETGQADKALKELGAVIHENLSTHR